MSIASPENTTAKKTMGIRLLLSWLVGSIAAYFLTGFLSNFYPSVYQFVLLSILLSLFGTIVTFLFLSEDSSLAARDYDAVGILTLLLAFVLSLAALMISWQFPGLFPRRILFIESSRLPFFILMSLISLGLAFAFFKRNNRFPEIWKQTRFFKFTQANMPGVLLAVFFFTIYSIFAETINFPGFRTLDLYFDTDISEWLARFTALSRQDVNAVRAVHPAVLLYLRPVVWFISVFLNGDRLHAAFLLKSLAGASCGLLAWLIVARVTGNRTYSLIMASILGASFSHLLLSSILESYIYSALAILFFIFLIEHENVALKYTLPAGVLIFGVTVTNLVQTCILYFFKSPRLKMLIGYLLAVVLTTAGLNLLQVWMYPNARSIFQPSNLEREQYYLLNPSDPAWRVMGRISLIARAIPLYGMVAPTPFILTKEMGMDVPNFRTYQVLLGEFHVAGYRGLADVTVKLWILILVVAGILFIVNFIKSPRQALFPLSLLLCLGFNFILHIVYGDDPMLYSPDWVYALVLFVALAFQRWSDRRWLQLGMLAFVALMMTTNLGLIHQIMQVSAPFYSRVLP